MIEIKEDLNAEKVIISVNLENFDKVVTPQTKRGKSNLWSWHLIKLFTLVPKDGQNRQKIYKAFPKSLS